GDHPLYMIMYFVLIVFFTYFYVAITFNPDEVADNMKKYGGFIPGIRAGRPTAEYLDYVLTRITLPGALYLGVISLIPIIALVALDADLRIPAISTGDIFRSNISQGTELGVRVQSILRDGGLVPDEVTNDMVRDRIAQDDCARGFILDGYPRTLAQVEALDGMLKGLEAQVDRVVELTVDVDEVVQRLHQRAVEEGREDDTP